MSMGSKRPGWRTIRNRYNYLTRDLQRKASDERAANRYVPALRLCLEELEQIHDFLYPECHKEGPGTELHPTCPSHEAMAAARKALGIP